VKSLGQKLEQLSGMLGTRDLSEWEEGFVSNVCQRCADGDTKHLTEKQVEVVERIYAKHFA
jgi:hypothetical protein